MSKSELRLPPLPGALQERKKSTLSSDQSLHSLTSRSSRQIAKRVSLLPDSNTSLDDGYAPVKMSRRRQTRIGNTNHNPHSIVELLDSSFHEALGALEYVEKAETLVKVNTTSIRGQLARKLKTGMDQDEKLRVIQDVLVHTQQKEFEESESAEKPDEKREELMGAIETHNSKTHTLSAISRELTALTGSEIDIKNIAVNYSLLPPADFRKQNNELLAEHHLVHYSNLDEGTNEETIKRSLLDRIPNYHFYKTDTGLLESLQGEKKAALLQFLDWGKLEVECRFPEDNAIEEKAANPKAVETIQDILRESEEQNPHLEFLKNPRYRDKPQGELALVAEPAQILFENYTPYKTYTKQLLIRNISQVSQRVRIQFADTMTFSEFFSFQLEESPIENNGQVAPGLCFKYTISFTPNSFGAFEETLLVLSESGTGFEVSIFASGNQPVLDLPQTLDCGQCRPGYTNTKEFSFSNKGSFARFIVIGENETKSPFELFDAIGAGNHGDPSSVQIGSYSISPGYFSVGYGETATLKVSFKPNQEQMDSNVAGGVFDIQKLVFACDNCQYMTYSLSGCIQTPSVAITGGRFVNAKRDIAIESGTDLFDLLMDFTRENIFASETCLLTIKNMTGLTLPFRWAQARYKEDIVLEEDRAPSDFTFEPQSGVLESWSSMHFKIHFRPTTNRKMCQMAELLMVDTNESNDGTVTKESLLKNETSETLCRLLLEGEGVPYEASFSTSLLTIPPGTYCGQTLNTEVELTNQSVSDLSFSLSIEGIDASVVKISLSETEGIIPPRESILVQVSVVSYAPVPIDGKVVCITANGDGPVLQLFVKGSIAMDTRTISFGTECLDFGLVALGNRKSISVPLRNKFKSPIEWQITTQNDTQDYLLSVEPSNGLLQPHEECMISVLYLPLWYQTLRDTLRVELTSVGVKSDTGSQQVQVSPILVSANEVIGIVQTPRMALVNNCNTFSCFVNVPVQWTLVLENTRMLPTYYKWLPIENEAFKAEFFPSEGSLKGGETQEIKVEVRFAKVGKNQQFKIQGKVKDMVEDDGFMTLDITADVVQYEFSFRVLENEQAWQDKAIMTQKNKSVSDAHLRLDFGLLCPISAVRTRTIKIRNHSAIESQFQVNFENYTPTIENLQQKDQKTELEQNVATSSSTPLLLRSTKKAKIGFSSKSGQRYIETMNKFRSVLNQMKQILSEGRGAAFHAVPHMGVIKPWGEVEIKVSSYNNLVGIYTDQMICQVEDINKIFQVRLGVVGTPVKVSGAQLISREKEVQRGGIDVEKVNFGARVINPAYGFCDGVRVRPKSRMATDKPRYNSGQNRMSQATTTSLPSAFSKVIQVDNHSPRDVILDWKVYIKHTPIHTHTEEGEKLDSDKVTVDMIVKPENLVEQGDIGIFEVTPSYMTIPAFKSAPLKCSFRNAELGSYEALIMADVAYVQKDGSVKYAPKRSKKPGEWPIEDPISQAMLASGNVTLGDLESVALFGIKAKCIEPKLTLEAGDMIRIKRNKLEPKKSVIAFLNNRSDAVCEFTLSTNDPQTFKVKGSKKLIKVFDPKKEKRTENDPIVYELKQTQQLMITVEYCEPENAQYVMTEWTPTVREPVLEELQEVDSARVSTIEPLPIISRQTSPNRNQNLMGSVRGSLNILSDELGPSRVSVRSASKSISEHSQEREITPKSDRESHLSRDDMAQRESVSRQSREEEPERQSSGQRRRSKTVSSVKTKSTPSTSHRSRAATVTEEQKRPLQQPQDVGVFMRGELLISYSNGMTQSIPIAVVNKS
ncbi:hypothetical protein EDD86DRAFT_199185 [Gorgonomyces haynaldii]|nr:hypothetical protein EDD86DRAFT_199185 [Gorgonomyces haynaldii]